MPKKKKRRTVHLHEARRILIDEELKKLVDMDDVVNEALDRVENHGVIFIDEIDKITGQRGQSTGDRKSTRLNSSHGYISYAVFCLKKKKQRNRTKSERAI